MQNMTPSGLGDSLSTNQKMPFRSDLESLMFGQRLTGIEECPVSSVHRDSLHTVAFVEIPFSVMSERKALRESLSILDI